MTNRRLHPRLRASVGVRSASGEPLGSSVCISLGGMHLASTVTLKIGQALDLVLEAPEMSGVVAAQVVWVSDSDAGLAFIEPDETERRGLTRMLHRLQQTGAPLDERRRCRRESIDLPIEWQVRRESRRGTLLDLAEQGALIVSGAPLPRVADAITFCLVSTADFEIEPPHATCQAAVRHVGSEGFGVEFVSPTPQFVEQVRAVLEWNAEKNAL